MYVAFPVLLQYDGQLIQMSSLPCLTTVCRRITRIVSSYSCLTTTKNNGIMCASVPFPVLLCSLPETLHECPHHFQHDRGHNSTQTSCRVRPSGCQAPGDNNNNDDNHNDDSNKDTSSINDSNGDTHDDDDDDHDDDCWLVAQRPSNMLVYNYQRCICSDKCMCCHIEIEVAEQTFYLKQPPYTDIGPTSPSADPITPVAWQSSKWSASFSVTGMTRPGKNPASAGIQPRVCRSRGGPLNH